jgi:methionine-rich copper-binding protein CopC
LGSSIVTTPRDTAYEDEGATAQDNEDGDISANLIINNPVNTAVRGSYLITYDVTDSDGNNATQVTRTVIVKDFVAPVITLVGDSEVTIAYGETYNDAGATATDNLDGDLTGDIITINPVNTQTIGTYIVTYRVSDSDGNNAQAVQRSVNVVDMTAPVINLLGDATVTITQGDSYTDAGATATDNVDGDISNNITVTNPVDTLTQGTYTVQYNVTDNSGNAAATVTRTVIINQPTDTSPDTGNSNPDITETRSETGDSGGGSIGLLFLLLLIVGLKKLPISISKASPKGGAI